MKRRIIRRRRENKRKGKERITEQCRECSSDGRAFVSHTKGKGIDTPHFHFRENTRGGIKEKRLFLNKKRKKERKKGRRKQRRIILTKEKIITQQLFMKRG